MKKGLTIKEALYRLGYKTIPSETPKRKLDVWRQLTVRNKFDQRDAKRWPTTRLNDPSNTYEARDNVDTRGPNSNYQGPMRGAGSGTRDRMPGTEDPRKKRRSNRYSGVI